MSELITRLNADGHASICILKPPDLLPDLPDSDWNLLTKQGFAWYTDFVAFGARGDNWAYSIEIYLANELTRREGVDRAILLPFTVLPEETPLLVTGSYGDPSFPFQLPSGHYKLLFETRFLTDEEIEATSHYEYLAERLREPDVEFYDEQRPELCVFTFIPTVEEVTPEILYPTYESMVRERGTTRIYFGTFSFDPRQELVIHNEPRPAGYA